MLRLFLLVWLVSIHAPLRRTGRPCLASLAGSEFAVSIHAPLRRTGRQSLACAVVVKITFQSTPRSEERGDIADSTAITAHGHGVSIHAPLRRTGRRENILHDLHWSGVSIHAPLRRTGRRQDAEGGSICWQFQSTPRSEERGDTIGGSNMSLDGLFQSTPRSEERGDPEGTRLAGLDRLGFNPRPAPKNGATSTGPPR